MELNVLKCHGMGNDYALVDIETLPVLIDERQMAKLVTLLCSRKGIVGADGVIFILPDNETDAYVRVFCPSGSESELCINGLRCGGRYIIEKYNKPSVQLRTAASNVAVEAAGQPFPGIHEFTMHIQDINRKTDPRFFVWPREELWGERIAVLSSDLRFFAITIGVPHIIAIVDKIDVAELLSIGEIANKQKDIFPQGVNVSFVAVLSDSKLYVRTYERGGSGLTQSCSSAMLASSFLMCELAKAEFDRPIYVYSSGGRATIICRPTVDKGKKSAEITSTSAFVYTAAIQYDPVEGTIASHFHGDLNDAEIMQYSRYMSSLGIGEMESQFLTS